MKQFHYSFSFILLFLCASCHHVNRDIVQHPDIEIKHIGAIYISCESPPWKITMDGMLSCTFDEPAPLGLNPINTCPLSTIADANGTISINFSENTSLGRIVVERLSTEIDLQSQDNESMDKLYVNDNDHFFIEKDNVRLKVNVKNSYIGGCFHELIRWEEVE